MSEFQRGSRRRCLGRWWLLILLLAGWAFPGGWAAEPLLSTVAAVRNLSLTEAGLGVPVEVRAVVTYYERKWETLFIQDDTAGCYVFSSGQRRPDLRAGQRVVVRGRSVAGGPVARNAIREESIEVLEDGPQPEARRLPYAELTAGRADGDRVSLEGIVRVVWSERGRLELDVVVEGGRIRAHLPWPDGSVFPAELLHARVRLAGACGLALSERGEVQGIRLFVPSLREVEVLAPAPDPATLPTVSLAQVGASLPGAPVSGRVWLTGVVTYAGRDGRVFVEEDGRGLELALVEPRVMVDAVGSTVPATPRPVLTAGDRVSAVGYPAERGGRRLLEEVEVSRAGPGETPVPGQPGREDWKATSLDGRLVRIQGRVLRVEPALAGSGGMERAVLEVNGVRLLARVEPAWVAGWDPGSHVELTGVAVVEREDSSSTRVRDWQLLVRGPADVRFLAAPGWWPTPAGRRMLLSIVLVVLALVVLALFLWWQVAQKRQQNALLERRIAERTAQLEEANASLRREIQERSRVAELQAAIYRISEATHAVQDLPALYRQLHEIIATLMPARNFYIALYDREANVLSFPYYADEKGTAPAPRPWSDGLSEYVIRSGEPLLADAQRLENIARERSVRQIGHEARVWLGVPLIVRGHSLGLMAVQDYHDRGALSAEHQRILLYVAGQTAMAIERKRAEAELRASEEAYRQSQERFRRAFASSPAIMSLARLRDGHLLEANEAFLKLTGYSREEVIGFSTIDLGIWFNRADREALIADVSRDGSVRGREVTIRVRDGSLRTALLSAELVEIEGEPCILAASVDLTERKQVEESLRAALAREKDLGELKSNFVSLVSHEFRTPLEVILSSAEILEHYHERLNADQRARQLRAIQKSVRRMAEMMNEVLLLGRFEAGRVEYHPQDVDLAAFLRRVAEEVATGAAGAANIRVEIPPELPRAQADESLLGHIFTNLVSNAVKYSSPGGEVRVEVARAGDRAVVRIIDQGCGIPAADLPRLFHAFHRGSNVGQRAGTGLGLVIVRRCIDRHGGTIDVASEEGRGTTVTVRLPVFAGAPGPLVHAVNA